VKSVLLCNDKVVQAFKRAKKLAWISDSGDLVLKIDSRGNLIELTVVTGNEYTMLSSFISANAIQLSYYAAQTDVTIRWRRRIIRTRTRNY